MIEPPTETLTVTALAQLPIQEAANSLGSTLEPDKSLLRKWLAELGEDKQAEGRRGRWRKIGWEVLERKALLLAAAKDLEDNGVPDPVQLAATDIFVEKAQKTLTTRGQWLYFFGAATAILAVATLIVTAWHIFSLDPLELLHIKKSSDKVSAEYLTILILKSTTAGALIVSVTYLLVALSRALLHEATVLYSRRHSLRFGRLFVYLKSSSMTREDIEKVFNWNAEFSTAFKDIQAENMTTSPISKVLESPAELIKALSELNKTIAKEKGKETERTSTEPA